MLQSITRIFLECVFISHVKNRTSGHFLDQSLYLRCTHAFSPSYRHEKLPGKGNLETCHISAGFCLFCPIGTNISAFANVKKQLAQAGPIPKCKMETKSSHSSSKRLRGKYIPKTELVPENDAWKTTSLSLPGNFSQAIVLCIYSYTYIYIHVYSCIQSVNTVNTIHAYCIHINIQVYQLWGLYEKKTR